jgi:ParB family chromosome partitioning protein
MIRAGKLTAGQARPLLSLEDPARISSLARQVVKDGLSAREVERRVREAPADPTSGTKRGRPRNADERSPEVRDIEQRLRKYFQTDVSIVLKARKRGSVVIDFYSADDLERLIELIGLTANPQ